MIVWFEYIEISQQRNSLGYGGYKDVQNEGYMWAETMIYDSELKEKTWQR